MNKEVYKDIGVIKNKWIETKDDYLDMSLNIISDLQQENKELKELYETQTNFNKELLNKFAKKDRENKELHNKIDKAIDFIENRRSGHDWYDRKDLLEILKGDVDE